jgi:hypothetical protein
VANNTDSAYAEANQWIDDYLAGLESVTALEASDDGFKNPAWDTARHLLANEAIRQMDATEVAMATANIALEYGGLGALYGMDDATATGALYVALKNCKVPEGQSILRAAYNYMKVSPRRVNTKCRLPLFVEFVEMLERADELLKGDPIDIHQETAAKLIGVTQRTISTYLLIAKDEGILVRTGKHYYKKDGYSKCASWQYVRNSA